MWFHRGGRPDNSASGIKASIEAEVPGIEFDVWYSRDREIVLIHGGPVGQIREVPWHPEAKVNDLSYEELQ